MLTALLIMLREGFEAALVVAIVYAYIRRIDRPELAGPMWQGIAAAAALSIGAGIVVHLTVESLEGRARLLAFAAVSMLAVIVLTWMIFWMRRQAANIKQELEAKLASAIAAGSAVGLASVVFFAVLREGWETALFLFAIGESSTPLATGIGAVVGLTISISLGVAIYMGSRRLNLRQFFTVTGILLIVFAAGLLAHAMHEFQEAGILPGTVEHLWNTNAVVSEDSNFGKFLTALFGYNGDPSALEVGVWFTFLATALVLFVRPLLSWRRTAASAQA